MFGKSTYLLEQSLGLDLKWGSRVFCNLPYLIDWKKRIPVSWTKLRLSLHNCKGVHGKYPLLQDGFLVVAICCWLVALCWNVISCDLESFPNCISKENLVLSSAGFEYYSQEFRDRAYVWRLITLVWELLSGQTGAFLKSSGPQLSVENKNSWILYRHHWENRIWREQT